MENSLKILNTFKLIYIQILLLRLKLNVLGIFNFKRKNTNGYPTKQIINKHIKIKTLSRKNM